MSGTSARATVEFAVGDDLTVAIGRAQTRLSPGEAFRAAERLIRSATVQMMVEEVDRLRPSAPKSGTVDRR